MIKKTTYIYGLVDPRNGKMCYVGKANNPEERLKKHFADRKHNQSKQKWFSELRDIGLRPRVVFLEKTSKDGWQRKEKFQIAFFRSRGMADLNIMDGGQGHTDYNSSAATRLKISVASSNCSPTTRLKISLALKGKPKPPFTEEHRKHIGDANRGRKPSEETRRRMSLAAKRNGTMPPQDYETRSRAQRGKKCKPFAEERKQKIAQKLKGNTNGAGHTYICTDETKAKLSIARRKRPPLPRNEWGRYTTRKE